MSINLVLKGIVAVHEPDPPKPMEKNIRENLSVCIGLEGEGVLQGNCCVSYE